MPTIEQKLTPNFSPGRKGRKPIAIVNHITAGLMPGTLNWLLNPAAEASAHYLITKIGRIIQLVKDEDTAWHAGIANRPSWKLYDGTNPNHYTIGIEHEGQPGDLMPEAQYQASLWLHRKLIKKWGIPVDRNHIIGHYQIDSVNRPNCPGPNFPWERLISDLRGGEEEVNSVKIVVNGKELTGILYQDLSYAPVRAIAEALGKTVSWDDKTKTVTIK